MYKIVNELSPDIMKDAFLLSLDSLLYISRNLTAFNYRPKRSVTYGSETISHLALKIWGLFLTHIKS